MTVKEVLIAARAKIEKPENWTQKAYARDNLGFKVMPSDDGAVCFCAAGALRSLRDLTYIVKENSWYALVTEMGTQTVSFFNDRHTHDQVLHAFDRAIAAQPN